MASKYKEFKGLHLPSIEKETLAAWEQNQAFEKSIALREGATPFVFYEGPPSANGLPGIHHVISRTLKDLVCRYKTMKGFQVKRKGGWDTHGLPIELGVEKELGITKEDIGKKISVEEYNRKCREAVLRYKDKWDDITKKMGYWVDLENPYVTFKNDYIETLWWLLSELYKKGFLYESVSIQPYSPAAGTGLSSHELNQPGTYKMVKDTSAVAMFKAVRNVQSQFLFNEAWDEDIFFMAWTTTPWTLPSNLGLAVGSNIDYVLVKTFNPYTLRPINVVLAKTLLNKYLKPEESSVEDFATIERMLVPEPPLNFKFEGLPWLLLYEFKGSKVEGCEYEQLLPFPANSLEKIKEQTPDSKPFRVMVGDFVTTEDGTGIVHIAPAFGADDYKIGRKNNIGILTLVDKRGKFLSEVKDNVFLYGEEYVKEDYLKDSEKAIEFKKQKEILETNGKIKDLKKYLSVDDRIILKLQEENKLFKKERYEHNYPHCWRTDKPILYYPLDAWFIRTTAVKDRMVELNKTINWKPKSTGEGRFGNWLENMVDWNLSRSRFWGTPLPIWKCEEVEYELNNRFDNPNDRDIFDSQRFDNSYDQLCVGAKSELKIVRTKGDWKCEGYYVDFDKINIDLDANDLNLINNIDRFKIKAKHGSNIVVPLSEAVKNYVSRSNSKKFSKDALVVYGFNLRVFENYITKITDDFIEKFDLHKPYIDNVIFSRDGSLDDVNLYIRVDDLIDVWFDSGAMPYAQWHFPFENKETFQQNFPADFIAEGVDQTRGWFYTLHALAVMLFDSVAYKTCVSNGLVLDKNGNKMSKRVGNVVDPFATIEQFGADATRWYLITNASPWDNLKFDLEGIKEIQRKFFGTLYNTYQFFALYANVDGFAFKEAYIPLAERPEIDRWILSSLNTLIKKVTGSFDEYEPTAAGRLIEDFVDAHLSNWYVRLCRRRFWKGEYEQDKISAYQTLYECVETILRLMAPVSPFFSDAIFQQLNSVTGRFKVESVHHADFPVTNEAVIDQLLEERMQLAQDASSLVLSLRKKINIKVRQPLQKILVPVVNDAARQQFEKIEDLIKTEVNVKSVEYLQGEDNGFISKKIKPNYVALGKRLGPKMKAVAASLSGFSQADISKLEKEGSYSLLIENEPVILQVTDTDITSEDIPGWMVANKGSLTVALDVTVTPELVEEGNAREIVNRIQKIRKDNGYELTDRILVQLTEHKELIASVNKYNTYICAEILADKLEFVPEISDGTEIEVNDIPLKVFVTKKV